LLHRDYVVAGILLLRHGEGDCDEDVNQRALQEYVTSRVVERADTSEGSSPLFQDPDRSIVSLPKLPPEPEPLTDWYDSKEVTTTLSSFVHDHLFLHWKSR
jgi:hypothetical protein